MGRHIGQKTTENQLVDKLMDAYKGLSLKVRLMLGFTVIVVFMGLSVYCLNYGRKTPGFSRLVQLNNHHWFSSLLVYPTLVG